jgi:hypothetical protein
MMSAMQSIIDNTVFVECFEMAILMSCMWLGWITWTFLLHFMTHRHQQQHLRTKVADAEAHMPEICIDAFARSPDSIEDLPALDDAQKVRLLLESHGAFGASPGTWVGAVGLELTSDSETSVDGEYDADAESNSDWEATEDFTFQSVACTERNLGMLFEHYSLFQSEPGTWSPAQGEDSDEASEDIAKGHDDLLSGSSVSILPGNDAIIDAAHETLANDDDCAAQSCSADEAGTLMEPLADPPHDGAASALFEQYSLFGAQPGTWSKDSDCSTSCSSESESTEGTTEDLASDMNSDAEGQ